ncbi:MAG TPA: hypothetical protein VKC54_01935 [Patescibacteria group bacterium]|nr:hypothetical protein [Patescibacteria group bacterium]
MAFKKKQLTTVELEKLNTCSIQHRLDVIRSLFSSFEEIHIEGNLTIDAKSSTIEMVFEKGKLQNKVKIKTI